MFALYSSTVLVLAPIATLRYHVAIPLARRERSAVALLVLSGATALLFASFLAVVMLVAGEVILYSLSLDPLTPYVMLIPLGVLAASLFETMTMWATRQRVFRTIAWTQILQSFLGEGLKVILGFASIGPGGLIVGHLSGHSLSVLNYGFQSAGRIRPALGGMSVKLLKLLAMRFRNFPIIRTPGQILLAFATQAPLFLVAANYDVSVAGQMGIAMLAFFGLYMYLRLSG